MNRDPKSGKSSASGTAPFSVDFSPAPSQRWLMAVGRATGGVAHDFNNALTAVMARATLLSSFDDPAVVEHAEGILRAATAASTVVERIRVILSPTRAPEFVRVDPAAVVRLAAELLQPRADAAGVVVAADPRPTVEVAGAPGELLQVVINLGTNAIDASRRGQTVVLKSGKSGSGASLEVDDCGTGIPDEMLEQLFEPFVTTKGEHGTGLGLALCRRIVDVHGGKLTLSPRPGGGTRARVTLRPAGKNIKRPRQSTGAELEALCIASSILLVDDDIGTALALSALLGAAGFEVTVARSLAEGLEHLNTATPDIVLTDLELGDGSGWSLARRIRTLDSTLPIVMLTGDVKTNTTSHRVSIDRIFHKPVNPGSLINSLRELSESRRALKSSHAKATEEAS